ncbi:MAG: aminoacyl-tRNA hydrolase [Anaerolineae bacterium]
MRQPLCDTGPSDPFLIVGLGNPGARYERTRHNVGFWCIDRLAQEWGPSRERRRFKGLLSELRLGSRRVILLKPQTFMNDSGDAVVPAVGWYKTPSSRLLVIHDDLDLPVGRMRVREGGSSGGHRGVDSIIERLGDDRFLRLRIGIGRPVDDAIDHVLSPFASEELTVVERVMDAVPDVVSCILEEGVSEAMNRYNGVDVSRLESL